MQKGTFAVEQSSESLESIQSFHSKNGYDIPASGISPTEPDWNTEIKPSMDTKTTDVAVDVFEVFDGNSVVKRDWLSKATWLKTCFLDIKERVERVNSETWQVEAVSLIFSVILLIILLFTLGHYNGKVFAPITHSITINTFLSVCIAIMITLLMSSLSSGIGQLKWIRAQGSPVRVVELDTLDQASRGPWGGLCLLFRFHGGMIGYLGAVTILLSVVVPPFAQQAVFTFIDWENSPTGEALLSVCNDMNNTGPGWMSSLSNISNYDTPYTGIPLGISAAIYSAIFGNFESTTNSPDFVTCSSGNCTWDPIATLGVCSHCENVTIEWTTYTVEGGGKTLPLPYIPGGARVDDNIDIFSMAPTDLLVAQDPSVGANGAFFKFSGVGNTGGSTMGFECFLQFCVQTFNSSVTNGALQENLLRVFLNSTLDDSQPQRLQTVFNASSVSAPESSPDPFNKPITLDTINQKYLSDYLPRFFVGGYSNTGGYTTDSLRALVNNSVQSGTAQVDYIFDKMDGIAASLSRELRTGTSCSGKQRLSGKALVPVTRIHINWKWMILPIVVEIFGIVFFIAVVFINRRSGVELWKTSILAELFHGVDFGSRVDTKPIERMANMENVAKKLVVRLDNGREGFESRLYKVERDKD